MRTMSQLNPNHVMKQNANADELGIEDLLKAPRKIYCEPHAGVSASFSVNGLVVSPSQINNAQ